MGVIRITLPRLGETMEEARVTEWLKAPGQPFRRGDVLLEVETDKTVVEVPALQDGTLVAHLVQPGEMVALDQPIADVEVVGASGAPEVAEPASPVVRHAPGPVVVTGGGEADGETPQHRASPLARRLAREAGLDLSQVPGTGRRGRVMGDDVRMLRATVEALPGDGPIVVRRVQSKGQARVPVVLLHGLYDTGQGWRDLPDRLARAGHPVLVPDLPGHGASTGAATTPDEAARMLAGLLPDGPVRLVGHSFGAALAAMLAADRAGQVERLVLIAPAGLGARINCDFLDIMAGAETPEALRRAMAMLGGGPISDAAVLLELARLRAQRAAILPLVRAVAAEGVQQIDIAPLLERVTAPVTAIFGIEDRIIDWRDCANLPASASIHLVRGAGHLPHVVQPALVAGLISDGAPQRWGADKASEG